MATYKLTNQNRLISPICVDSRGVNKQIKKRQSSGPTMATIRKWHEEFIQSGAQFRMSFQQFRKHKRSEWRAERNRTTKSSRRPIKAQTLDNIIHKETIFISGKYQGQNIETILKYDPKYCIWCLENSPRSIVSQQIIAYHNR